jgi:ABC-type antimicrobial peptide transport system permease subunit
VARLDPDVAVARIATLSSIAAASIAPQRFGAMLFLLFAAAAALLAGIGVYGVMSYVVAQWRHELGVRLALGATPRTVFALIMRRGLVLTSAGTIAGVLGALAIGPVMSDLLYGVRPGDPATLVLVPLILAAVALIACAIPGQRAARIDPLEALRQ